MKQAIQKFSQYCERRFHELLMKNTVVFCCVVTIVGSVCLFFAYGHIRILTALYAIGAVLAASVALIQWASDRRVKRAELLDQLIEKITTIDPNSLLEVSGSGDTRELEKQDQEFSAKLSFLSYIAYLEATGILSDDEFNALRLDLVRILEHEMVADMIEEACQSNKDSKYTPYFYLVKYGAANCKSDSVAKYRKILDSRSDQMHEECGSVSDSGLQEHLLKPDNSGAVTPVSENIEHINEPIEEPIEKEANEKDVNKKKDEIIDFVSSGKTYRTHVDVLNGIFKFSYRAHMRGGATLPDGRVVWFPKYDSTRQEPLEGNPKRWVNILDSKEGVLSEYWPLGDEPTGDRWNRWNTKPRYVFGMDLSSTPPVYRFLGIYKYERREKNHLVYKRQDVVLRQDEVEHSLNPGNY